MQWGFDWGFASAPLVDGDSAHLPGRRLAGRPRRRLRQDDRGRTVAGSAERGGPRGRAAHHHRGRGGAAAHHLESRGGRLAGSGDGGDVLAAAVRRRRSHDGGGAGAGGGRPALLHHVLRRSDDAGPQSGSPGGAIAWKGNSNSENPHRGPARGARHPPIIDGGYIYGICSYGQLRCLDAETGERIWETQAATVERRRWVSGFMVKNRDRVFLNNDRGELIIARMSPAGYDEISRTRLIEPTSLPGNRRGAAQRQLGPSRLRQPACVDPERRGDRQLLAGCGRLLMRSGAPNAAGGRRERGPRVHVISVK